MLCNTIHPKWERNQMMMYHVHVYTHTFMILILNTPAENEHTSGENERKTQFLQFIKTKFQKKLTKLFDFVIYFYYCLKDASEEF